MSDDEERQLNKSSIGPNEMDNRRRLSEIKNELQGLMRQKKKYDEEKLKQDGEFLQGEINDLRNSITDINREINNQTQTKKRLHVDMTNLRSRSRLRYTNLAIALRDKRRYEVELKKQNKTEEYRDLARREIRSIDAALPILKEEDEYKARLKVAEDAQQVATIKRKKLEDSLNKNLRKQSEIKELLNENAEKLPQIEATIENLRSERERLLSSSTPSTTNGKKSRRRLSTNQRKLTDPPTPVRSFASLEEDCLEHEKQQAEEQLKQVNTLINYFHEKLTEHGLNKDQIYSAPSSELTSPLYHQITPHEERTILSSYMEDQDSDHVLLSKTTTNDSPTAIAMKLPRNFASLDLNSTPTNQIIHSPLYDGNEIEYKKEFSSDIINKYGGQTKKNKQQLSLSGKHHKKNKKNFAVTHIPQMIVLYNNIRGSSDTLPSMPMYEYDLFQTIQSLELLKQSLESYLTELSIRYSKCSIDNDQQSKSEDDDIRDSALDTVSETSSLIEPIKQTISPNNLETRSSTSSDEKKTLISSSSPSQSSKIEELNSHLLLYNNPQIDRQISDEGYRSVQNEQQQSVPGIIIGNPSSPLLTRSKSYDCTEKVDRWLAHATPLPSSLPMTITYNTDFQV